MSFSPPPPPGTSSGANSIGGMASLRRQFFSRRPQVWVPPVIVFGAFAAGYAIPWEFGEDTTSVVFRIVIPLSMSAAFCLVAGFYSYRTVPGWRMWTWIAFIAMLLNALHASFFAYLMTPEMVEILLWFSVLGLGIAASFGSEKLSDIHRKPTLESPGLNT